MTLSDGHTPGVPGAGGGACPTHLLVQDRCRVLGLPTWRFDASGTMLSAPSEIGAVGAFLRAPSVVSRIQDAVAAWTTSAAPGAVELWPGLWLVPLVENHRRKRAAYLVAAAMEPQALQGECFKQVCAEVNLDPLAAAPALSRQAVYTRAMVERLTLCLAWTHADLEALAGNETALAGFSCKLAESYEENSLLYKLGKSMNQLVQPQKFVALACDELQATLPFEWIAIRFIADRKAARSMAAKLFASGAVPCDTRQFDAEVARILATLAPGKPAVLAPEQRGPLGKGQSQLLVHPVTLNDRVVAGIFAGNKRGDDTQVSSTDMKLLDAASSYLSILLDNAVLYDDQQLMFVGTLEALTASIDAKDPYTCGHSERVAELAAALASAHGLPDHEVERIRMAGIVHDVGKIGVPEAVLCKTGRLDEEEFRLIKQHPEIGYQILKDIPQFGDLLPGVLYHHERYDGRGYPRGLLGPDIPLMARIIGLVDAFDAMSSNRTYRAAMARERVFEELEDCKLTQFDPQLVDSFKKVDLARYDHLVEQHQTESQEGGLRIRRRGLAA